MVASQEDVAFVEGRSIKVPPLCVHLCNLRMIRCCLSSRLPGLPLAVSPQYLSAPSAVCALKSVPSWPLCVFAALREPLSVSPGGAGPQAAILYK